MMSRDKIHTLIFTTALGLVVAAPPAFGQSREERADRNRDAAERAEGRNTRMRYEDLPPAVKDALDHERGDRRVVSVYQADRSDRSWYSVIIETRRGDRVIRISQRGAVLSVADLNDDDVKVFRENPDRWYHDWSDRQNQREKFYYRDLDQVHSTVDHPDRLDWDRIPARVRATFLRMSLGDRPTGCIRYRQGDTVLYQTSFQDGPNRQHMVQVTPDGAVFAEGYYDSNGHFLPGKERAKTILAEDLPNRVRDVVDREAPRGQIAHIDVLNRNGHDVFTVEIDRRSETRYLTISESGKVLSDISDKY